MFDCDVTTCDDGESCIEAVQRIRPLIALVDLQMPRMSGMAVAKALRESGISDVTLVAITGYGGTHIQRLCAEAGFDHHELKPIHAIRISELLAIAAQRAEARYRVGA